MKKERKRNELLAVAFESSLGSLNKPNMKLTGSLVKTLKDSVNNSKP